MILLVGGVGAWADASAAAPVSPRSATEVVAPPTVTPAAVQQGHKVTVSGTLPKQARRPVKLVTTRHGHNVTVAKGTTTVDGGYRFSLRAPRRNHLTIRLTSPAGTYPTPTGRTHLPAVISKIARLRIYAHPLGSKAAERTALLDLRKDTKGHQHFWSHEHGWNTKAPVCTWSGITCKHGYVRAVDLPGEYGDGVDGAGWLTGGVPRSIENLTHLRRFSMADQHLDWYSLSGFHYLTGLRTLVLGDSIRNHIPSWIGTLTNLRVLSLQGAFLRGIPSSIGNLTQLQTLVLSGNGQMTGTIPASIGKLARLRTLNLSGDGLTGQIPSEIGDLAGLTDLVLDRNRLSGALPDTIGRLAQLQQLSLRSNQVSGSIPSTIGSLASLVTLDLGNNRLSGPIPDSIMQLTKLQNLFMDGNQGCQTAGDPTLLAWLAARSYVPKNGCIVTLGESPS